MSHHPPASQLGFAKLSAPYTQKYTCTQDERMSSLEPMTTDDLQLPPLQESSRSLPGQPVNWLTALSCNYQPRGALALCTWLPVFPAVSRKVHSLLSCSQEAADQGLGALCCPRSQASQAATWSATFPRLSTQSYALNPLTWLCPRLVSLPPPWLPPGPFSCYFSDASAGIWSWQLPPIHQHIPFSVPAVN